MAQEDIKKEKPKLEDLNITKKTEPYDKKVKIYFTKIIIEILLIAVFSLFIFLFQKYEKKLDKDHEKEVVKINKVISKLKNDTKNMEGKVSEVIKFKEKWDKSSSDLIGLNKIKPNYLQNQIKSLSSKYKIHNLTIKNNKKVKTDIKSLALRKLYLESITGKMSFSSMTDIEAINYIENIINDLPGFFIISKISITKNQDKYTSEDILKIKQGIYNKFIIDFKIDYTWYVINGE